MQQNPPIPEEPRPDDPQPAQPGQPTPVPPETPTRAPNIDVPSPGTQPPTTPVSPVGARHPGLEPGPAFTSASVAESRGLPRDRATLDLSRGSGRISMRGTNV
jgi:hypothetical protein